MINGNTQTVEFPEGKYFVTPFIDGPLAGQRFTRASDGKVTHVYLNPSTGGDSGPDAFVYSGEHATPDDDAAICFVNAEFADG